ncbi:MAG: hypothetical protein R2706_15795 [Acidimicrobiales bacterium]
MGVWPWFWFQLGAGILTYITASAVLLWLATLLAVGTVAGAVLLGGAFGVGSRPQHSCGQRRALGR